MDVIGQIPPITLYYYRANQELKAAVNEKQVLNPVSMPMWSF